MLVRSFEHTNETNTDSWKVSFFVKKDGKKYCRIFVERVVDEFDETDKTKIKNRLDVIFSDDNTQLAEIISKELS